MKRLSQIFAPMGILALVGLCSSCVPLAVGAVGGYLIADDGVRLQSPITRKPKQQEYQDYHY